jgi:hypothetical protein
MPNLILKRITLLSFKERKARRVQFHPNITIIQGDNQTGKSSLLKSIYWTFGTEPKKIHPKWKAADPISVVDFSIDDLDYTILRHKDIYAIFDDSRNMIGRFTKVTSELGPFLSELLNYKVKLNDKKNEAVTPPPAYFFLPFYIDQDVSWKDNWNSFERLGQFDKWRDPIINYHTGIRPNEYYEIKALIDALSKQVGEIEAKNKVNKKVLKRLIDQFNSISIDIDIDVFRKEIDEMMHHYGLLSARGEVLKEKIIELSNHKIHTQQQIDITRRTISELKLDYKFSLELEDNIECPTCGQIHENSFTERFAIARDEDRCHELLLTLQKEMIELDEEIDREYEIFDENNEESEKIKEILEKKQEEVKLRDVIQNEGKKELRNILETEINTLTTEIVELEVAIKEYKEELKGLENKERTKAIKNEYLQNMHYFLDKLDVRTMTEDTYKAITSTIKESGSGLPRGLLAYYFSILKIMKKHSSATFCPIIIDSPNQQDQDAPNLARMINIILTEKPTDTQLILGLVELGDYEFDGEIIEMTEKYSLLNKTDYDLYSAEVRSLLDICLTP